MSDQTVRSAGIDPRRTNQDAAPTGPAESIQAGFDRSTRELAEARNTASNGPSGDTGTLGFVRALPANVEDNMTLVPTILGPIYVDDQGEIGQPVALLWPSLFSDHRMWERQIGPLRAAGWRTLALDPPGHGNSPGPGRPFSMDECTAVALAVIDTLAAGVPVVMLGTSWGGMIAPRVAHARPGRLAGLVMTNTTAEAPDLKTKLIAKLLTVMLQIPAIDKRVDTMLLSMQMSDRTRTERPEIARTYAARFRAYRRKPFVQAVDSVLVRRDAFLDKLHEVATPALILSGADDTILPTAMNRRIADRLPDAEAIEIAGAAHLVPVERPEECNALMLDRMDRWIGRHQ